MYLRHLSTKYWSILSAYRPSLGQYIDRHSADMSAETQLTYRPTSTDTHISRHPADTSLPLGRYFTDTQPTLRSFAQLSLLSSIFSSQLRGLSGPSSFFGLQLRKHSCLFSSYVFFLRRHFCIQPSLLS